MNVAELAHQLQLKHEDCNTVEIARLCVHVLNAVEDPSDLDDPEKRDQACRDAILRHQFATDQHEAMTSELEELAASDPSQFEKDQIWVLVRAIKVQSQVLSMYLGDAALDV